MPPHFFWTVLSIAILTVMAVIWLMFIFFIVQEVNLVIARVRVKRRFKKEAGTVLYFSAPNDSHPRFFDKIERYRSDFTGDRSTG